MTYKEIIDFLKDKKDIDIFDFNQKVSNKQDILQTIRDNFQFFAEVCELKSKDLIKLFSAQELEENDIYTTGYLTIYFNNDLEEDHTYVILGNTDVIADTTDNIDIDDDLTINILMYDNSTLTITGDEHIVITGNDSSNITAYNKLIINANGHTNVNAYDNITVFAYDKSKIKAYGTSEVLGNDSSKIYGYENAKITAHDTCEVFGHNNSKIAVYNSVKAFTYDDTICTFLDNTTGYIYDKSNAYILSAKEINGFNDSTITMSGVAKNAILYDDSKIEYIENNLDKSSIDEVKNKLIVLFNNDIEIKNKLDKCNTKNDLLTGYFRVQIISLVLDNTITYAWLEQNFTDEELISHQIYISGIHEIKETYYEHIYCLGTASLTIHSNNNIINAYNKTYVEILGKHNKVYAHNHAIIDVKSKSTIIHAVDYAKVIE